MSLAPGIYGVISTHPETRDALKTLLRDSGQPSSLIEHVESSLGFSVGRIGAPGCGAITRTSSACGVTVVLHGDIDTIGGVEVASGVSILDKVREHYVSHGISGVARSLTGPYCAAIVDVPLRKAFVINDRLGTHPHYWLRTPKGVIFGASVLALIQAGDSRPDLDLLGAAEFLRFGHLLGERTLCRGVALIPPGSWLDVNLESAWVESTRYSAPSDFFGVHNAGIPGYEGAIDAFERATRRAHNRSAGVTGITLSGGLDSRAILVALGTKRDQVRSFTCGVSGCADERVGAQLAKACGLDHRFLPHHDLDLDETEVRLRKLVRDTDGMYLSHGLTELHDIAWLETQGCDVLFRGHAGELAKMRLAWPFHTGVDVSSTRSNADLAATLMRRFNFAVTDASLVTGSFRPVMCEHPRDALEVLLKEVDVEPRAACAYLYLFQHHRRFTAASLAPFRRHSKIEMPFSCEVFLRELLTLPMAMRENTTFHRNLIRRHGALARIENTNTGAPAGAGPLRSSITERVATGLSKLRIRGYRHYHSVDSDVRETVLPIAEVQLLSNQARTRELFRPTALRTLIDSVRQGVPNRGLPLLAILTLELWLQEASRP